MTRLRFIVASAPLIVYAAPAVAVPLLPPAPPLAALTYEFVGNAVTTDVAGRSHEQVLIRGRVMSFGDRARIDIDEAGSANSSMRGSYMLLSEGGNKILWVNPLTRQYRETDSESMLSGLNDLSNGSNGLITMQASNVRVDAQKIGAGPVIQGHNTVHYRLTQHMDMRTRVLSRTATTHDDQIIDYYYATDIPGLINPFLPSAPSLPLDGPLLSDDYTNQLRAAIDKLYQGGAALRTVVSSKSTDAVGHSQSAVTITTEVTNVRRSYVNSVLFDLPNGYAKVSNLQSSIMRFPDLAQLRLQAPFYNDIRVVSADDATSVANIWGVTWMQGALANN